MGSQEDLTGNATDSAIRQPLDGTLRLKPQDPSVSRIARAFSPDHSTRSAITNKRKSGPVFEQPFQDLHSLCDLGELCGSQLVEVRSQVGDAELTPFLQQGGALGSGTDAHAAGVVGVRSDPDKAAAIEASHDAAHGGRLDLFGGGKF